MRQMRRWLIPAGAVALGVGIFGVYDEYFVFVEFLKGSMQPGAAFAGLVAILAGLFSRRQRLGQVILGVALLGIGIYGYFDEYFAVLDFIKGAVPPVLLLAGITAVVTGVKRLA